MRPSQKVVALALNRTFRYRGNSGCWQNAVQSGNLWDFLRLFKGDLWKRTESIRGVRFLSAPHLYLLSRHSLNPPAQPRRGISGGRPHVEHRIRADRRTYEVEVGAQHHQDGEEGEAEAEASDGAAQGEAEPVDESESMDKQKEV